MEPEHIPGVPAVPGVPARLMSRDFTLLWLGQTVSQLGNQAYSIGMVFWLMKATGSASLMGLLLTVSSLPGVLLGPFGGTFADRHSRIRIIVVSDLLAGCGIGFLALALWLRPDDTRLIIPLLFTVSILLGIARAAFGPALSAAVPELVPPERLAAANSLTQISTQGSIFVGQAVGGVLYGVVGAPLLFLLDSLSFFFAAGTGSLRRFVQETAEGFRYVWARKGMRDFLFGVSLINFLAMPGTVLFPFFVELYLHAGPSWYGFLMASLSIGAVTGFILAGTLRLRGTRRMQGVLTAMFLYPVCFSILALLRTPSLAVIALFAGGVTVGVINVYLITLLQAATVAELRGRVMGLLGTLSGGLIPLGMALGGVVGDLTGKNVPLIILVTSGVAFVVVLSLALRPSCREFLRGT
jgi:MFS family permease